jgi:hypothetical protein
MSDNHQSSKNDQQMCDKDKFDAYLKLADYWEGRYEERRGVEWKVSLGLWAVILTGIANSEKLRRPPCFALWLSVAWLVYVIVWLTPILYKNKWDKELSHCYADAGTALIPACGQKENEKTQFKKLLDVYSFVFHSLTTGLLLLALNYSLRQ